MENNNLSEESIRTMTLRICNRYNYKQDMSDIIAGDLASGVSEDELSLYVGKKLSIRKVVVMSQCLRNKYSKEVIDIICDSRLSEYQMEVALKAYKSIGTVEGLKKALEETGYVPDRVKITANKVDKKRSDLPVKDNHIETLDEVAKIKEEESERKDQAEIQRLIDELAERERELEAKQKVYQARITELQEQIAAEEDRTKELAELRKYTQTNAYIEEIAKEKLGLVRPGEIIFKIKR